MTTLNINWKTTLLTLWAVFSFVYISYNIYNNFRTQVLQNAYMTGKSDTVNALIEQASNKECKPFNVYAGEKKVDLINVSCLQQAPKESSTQAPAVPQK